MKLAIEGTLKGLRHAITMGQPPEVELNMLWPGGAQKRVTVELTVHQYQVLRENLQNLNRVCSYVWTGWDDDMKVCDARHGTLIVHTEEDR